MLRVTKIEFQASSDCPECIIRALPIISTMAHLSMPSDFYETFDEASDAVYAAVDRVIEKFHPTFTTKIRASVMFSPMYSPTARKNTSGC